MVFQKPLVVKKVLCGLENKHFEFLNLEFLIQSDKFGNRRSAETSGIGAKTEKLIQFNSE